MADTFVDLKVDRSLIDPHFEGYKLSLDKIPVYQHSLESPVQVTSLREDQYSYQHVKAFGTQNHLFPDPYSDAVYIIDTRRKVVKVCIPKDSTTLSSSSVLAVPAAPADRSCPDVVSPSMHCPAAEWTVVADGQGTFHVVHTGNRCEDNNWEVKFSSTLDNEATPFTIVHSVCHESNQALTIEAVFLTVTKNEEKEEAENNQEEEAMDIGDQQQRAPVTKSAFLTTLHWITLTQDEHGWKISRRRKLSGAVSPDYVAVEEDGEAIIVSSEKTIRFVSDSEKPVETKKREKWVVVEEAASADPPPLYTWSQTMQDVSVTFTLPPGTAKVDVLYKLSCDRLELGVKNGQKLLAGHLHASVDPEGSTWTLDSDTRRLTVELSKCEEALWPVVVLGDSRGEMTLDPSQVEEVHQRLAHLTSEQWNPDPSAPDSAPPYNAQQLEDCDIFLDDNCVLARIDGNTHAATHQVNLGGLQHLFTAPLRPPAFCLRHDVDGVLWQPCKPSSSSSSSSSSSEIPFTHAATFNALGFVAASKQDRKFSVCAPDASFAALVDCTSRVYVYRRPAATATPLRNRRTGQQQATVAHQQLVSLESPDAILGAQATNTSIVILQANTVYMLKTVQEKI